MAIFAGLIFTLAFPWLYAWTTGAEVADIILDLCVGLGCLGLTLCVIFVPLSHMNIQSQLVEHREVQRTIDAARKQGRPVESAAMQVTITERNADLANMKYYNGTVFGLWIPDEVEEYEPIR